MSEVYDCRSEATRAEGIAAAAAAVRDGGVIVLPTDTVYGIGCDAFDADAVAAVLAAKGRGRDMPPPVLIPTARTAHGLAVDIPAYATTLMDRFWPGPLTLVLKAHTSLNWDLGETNGTVALRVPDHPVARELLSEIGPMAVTSANTTGSPAARNVFDARGMLGETVSVYLDAGQASEGEASTILDCTGETPRTLRLGALSQEEIDAVLAPAEPEGDGEGADAAEADAVDSAEAEGAEAAGPTTDQPSGADTIAQPVVSPTRVMPTVPGATSQEEDGAEPAGGTQ